MSISGPDSRTSARGRKAKAAPAVALGRGRPSQAPRLRDAKQALYHEHIIGVAEQIFADMGFTAARMQDIAAAAGVSLAKLYQFYESKDELFRGVLVIRGRQLLEQIIERHAHLVRAPQSIEQVLWLLELNVLHLLGHPNYLRLLLREGYAWYAQAAHASREEQEMWELASGNMAAMVDWGIDRGFFIPCDLREQGRLIVAVQQTRFANWVLDEMRAPHESVVAQVQADFLRICCRPAVAAKLLAENGVELRPATIKRVAELRKTLAPQQP